LRSELEEFYLAQTVGSHDLIELLDPAAEVLLVVVPNDLLLVHEDLHPDGGLGRVVAHHPQIFLQVDVIDLLYEIKIALDLLSPRLHRIVVLGDVTDQTQSEEVAPILPFPTREDLPLLPKNVLVLLDPMILSASLFFVVLSDELFHLGFGLLDVVLGHFEANESVAEVCVCVVNQQPKL